MASNETEAYKIMRQLDVDYALVIFGGMSGYRCARVQQAGSSVACSRHVLPWSNVHTNACKVCTYHAQSMHTRPCVPSC